MKEPNTLPARIWILTLSAFAIGTAEFLIAGILPQVAESLGSPRARRATSSPPMPWPSSLAARCSPSGWPASRNVASCWH